MDLTRRFSVRAGMSSSGQRCLNYPFVRAEIFKPTSVSISTHSNNRCETAHFSMRSEREVRNSHDRRIHIVERPHRSETSFAMEIMCNCNVGNYTSTHKMTKQIIVDLTSGRHDHRRQDNRVEWEQERHNGTL